MYRGLRQSRIAARGAALALIPESRVPQDILVKLESQIDLCRRFQEEAESRAADDE